MPLQILTVDDSRAVHTTVRRALRKFTAETVSAANGAEGLALAAHLMPALILLDIAMPVMDGVEMLQRLRAHRLLRTIPVVMLTQENSREHGRNILKLGVQGYLVKPLLEDEVVFQLGQLIGLPPARSRWTGLAKAIRGRVLAPARPEVALHPIG